MRRVWAAMARLDGSWLGDVIGVLCLFAIPVLVMFAGLVFGCPE
jgi:hypothetical protein